MKLGIISDTHDRVDNIIKMVNILNQHQVKLVIHCGDWVAPFTLQYYQPLKCPLRGVFGNNDGDKFRHLRLSQTKKFKVDVEYEDTFLELEIDKRKLAVYHGDYASITHALVTCGEYDAVFHGHTHVKVNQTVGKVLSLNPGTLLPQTSPTVKGASFAIYDTATNSAEIIRL